MLLLTSPLTAPLSHSLRYWLLFWVKVCVWLTVANSSWAEPMYQSFFMNCTSADETYSTEFGVAMRYNLQPRQAPRNLYGPLPAFPLEINGFETTEHLDDYPLLGADRATLQVRLELMLEAGATQLPISTPLQVPPLTDYSPEGEGPWLLGFAVRDLFPEISVAYDRLLVTGFDLTFLPEIRNDNGDWEAAPRVRLECAPTEPFDLMAGTAEFQPLPLMLPDGSEPFKDITDSELSGIKPLKAEIAMPAAVPIGDSQRVIIDRETSLLLYEATDISLTHSDNVTVTVGEPDFHECWMFCGWALTITPLSSGPFEVLFTVFTTDPLLPEQPVRITGTAAWPQDKLVFPLDLSGELKIPAATTPFAIHLVGQTQAVTAAATDSLAGNVQIENPDFTGVFEWSAASGALKPIIGTLPTQAVLQMEAEGPLEGQRLGTALNEVQMMLPSRFQLEQLSVDLFGLSIPLIRGQACQTEALIDITLAPVPQHEGALSGDFEIPDLSGCGPLTPLVNILLQGTARLTLIGE